MPYPMFHMLHAKPFCMIVYLIYCSRLLLQKNHMTVLVDYILPHRYACYLLQIALE